AKRVTCFTCHNGDYDPKDVPILSIQYGVPPEYPNAMEIIPAPGASVDQIFDDYIQALGGQERVAGLTSFAATGTYSGFDTSFAELPVEIYAEAPDRRTTIIREMLGGDSTRTYDGRNGWTAGFVGNAVRAKSRAVERNRTARVSKRPRQISRTLSYSLPCLP
ncbi:MAG: hypothetical protein IH935_12065, partial [Acidobacteria bacterium]|nr:hypothetical protein [Acidobacteriota bacterium]